MRTDLLRLRPEDDVLVSTRPLAAGEAVAVGPGETLAVERSVPLGHKVAAHDIAPGAPIRKYGQIIGYASAAIPRGAHVHVHNCTVHSPDGTSERDYAFASDVPPAPRADALRTFRGYRRADGRAGTRNYIAVISTVNCSASVSRAICDRFPKDELARWPSVDGLLPITHKSGCGIQYGGEDHDQLERVLAGYARHPNVGAYLIVGLGCEVAQTSHLVEAKGLVQVHDTRGRALLGSAGSTEAEGVPPLLTIQESGGTARTILAGIDAIRQLLPLAARIERVEIPASKLVLGLQCGGSDGSSGITANPALGVASDLLVAQGGTTVLGETTEIYGAEHLLTRRAITREVGEALVERLRWWEWYTGVFGAEIDNNPSPGNKAGGLTTIFEKSLGAIAKGGSTALRAVYRYAEPVTEPGFVVMDTPGYDPASLTGIVAGGANICCFTTGRGSVYGSKPAPCLKVSTNTPLYERMRDDMDIDAGVILAGTPVESVGRDIFEALLRVASGEKTKSEAQGLGEEEFLPWSIGPTL